ncbi:MAG: 2OG-Fe(II) oxygenase [Candidatus Eremiobacteraeota bacterium]|nr:2OG-Fe(II) oxygenase [Candidatus Eremiobacteraeota bacterium]
MVTQPNAPALERRIRSLDWPRIEEELDTRGFALTGVLLDVQEREALSGAYGDDALYRSRVIMSRHGFGSGEYKYYAYPLPAVVAALRAAVYPYLVPVANRWAASLRLPEFPGTLSEMVERCHAAGQTRPTPLILRYAAGDYNCLHQDVYGENVFPVQLTVLLSEPHRDFEGGEFLLVEQRPRKQSRAEVVVLGGGEGVLFSVSTRPVRGIRGTFRATMRHGVATVRAGQRTTLGVIFHEAR